MTENEFEKRFMAEMSEQQNTAVKAVQGAVLLLAVPGCGTFSSVYTVEKYSMILADRPFIVLISRPAPHSPPKRSANLFFSSRCDIILNIFI